MRARAGAAIPAGVLYVAIAALGGGCEMADYRSAGLYPPSMEPKRAVFVELRKEDRAAFEEGLALVAELKYAQAEERFSRVVGWYRATGDEARASETLFWQGYCREKLGQMGAARQTYQLLVALYPGTPAARQADERMRRLPMGPPPATQPAARPDEPAPQGARPSGNADAATAGRALKGL